MPVDIVLRFPPQYLLNLNFSVSNRVLLYFITWGVQMTCQLFLFR